MRLRNKDIQIQLQRLIEHKSVDLKILLILVTQLKKEFLKIFCNSVPNTLCAEVEELKKRNQGKKTSQILSSVSSE